MRRQHRGEPRAATRHARLDVPIAEDARLETCRLALKLVLPLLATQLLGGQGRFGGGEIGSALVEFPLPAGVFLALRLDAFVPALLTQGEVLGLVSESGLLDWAN